MVNLRVRTLIKAYLIFHKGKRCTAKEISEFINGHWFGLNRSLVNPRTVSNLIMSERVQKGNILSEVQVETVNNLKHYWVI